MSRPHCEAPAACESKGKGHCRRRAAKALYRDPAVREAHKAGVARFWDDPERSAPVRERVRQLRLNEPKDQRICNRADKVQGGRTRTMQRIGWIPLDLRPLYETLRRDFGAAEAQRMIREQIERDGARAAKRQQQSLERLTG